VSSIPAIENGAGRFKDAPCSMRFKDFETHTVRSEAESLLLEGKLIGIPAGVTAFPFVMTNASFW
jgi:hypothetical protein